MIVVNPVTELFWPNAQMRLKLVGYANRTNAFIKLDFDPTKGVLFWFRSEFVLSDYLLHAYSWFGVVLWSHFNKSCCLLCIFGWENKFNLVLLLKEVWQFSVLTILILIQLFVHFTAVN